MGWSRKIAFAFKRPRKTDQFLKKYRFKDVLLETGKTEGSGGRIQEGKYYNRSLNFCGLNFDVTWSFF